MKTLKFGFVPPAIDETHYVLGGLVSIPKSVIQPDGQWDSFLPTYEPQFGGQFDTDGCSVWGTQNAIETLVRKLCGREDNYSERFTYILAGIRPPGGDPHAVAETIRAKGLIAQTELPMTSNFNEFILPDPMTEDYLSKGRAWLNAFEFKHEWIYTKQPKKEDRIALIKESLRYSPVCISVTAWFQEGDVYVDRGQRNCHWVMCYGWNDKGWKVFDSYDQTLKVYSFDSSIEFAKRFYIGVKNKEEQISLLKKLISRLLELVGLMSATPTVPLETPTSPATPTLPVSEPKSTKYDWDTPILARHSVRVICDEEGLTVEQKNSMCATIGAESGWKIGAINRNKNRSGDVTSSDYGLCQWNDFYHGKEISPDEALHNPEKAVRLMCAYWKRGECNLWMAYKSGAFKNFL